MCPEEDRIGLKKGSDFIRFQSVKAARFAATEHLQRSPCSVDGPQRAERLACGFDNSADQTPVVQHRKVGEVD